MESSCFGCLVQNREQGQDLVQRRYRRGVLKSWRAVGKIDARDADASAGLDVVAAVTNPDNLLRRQSQHLQCLIDQVARGLDLAVIAA